MHNERTPEGLHAALRNALQALKSCSRQTYTFPSEDADYSTKRTAELYRDVVECGDACAVNIGPLAQYIAEAAGLTTDQARRYLLELEQLGLAMRQPEKERGSPHRWWPVGFADDLQEERHALNVD